MVEQLCSGVNMLAVNKSKGIRLSYSTREDKTQIDVCVPNCTTVLRLQTPNRAKSNESVINPEFTALGCQLDCKNHQ